MRMRRPRADEAKSLDSGQVAEALEGLEFEVFDGGKGFMRKDDHQFFQPIYIASLGERSREEPFDEKDRLGWKLVAKIDTPARASDQLQDGTAETERSRRSPSPRLRGEGTAALAAVLDRRTPMRASAV